MGFPPTQNWTPSCVIAIWRIEKKLNSLEVGFFDDYTLDGHCCWYVTLLRPNYPDNEYLPMAMFFPTKKDPAGQQ